MNAENLPSTGGQTISITRRQVRLKDSVTGAKITSSTDLKRSTRDIQEDNESYGDARRSLAVAGEDLPPGILSDEIITTTPIDVGTVFWGEDDSTGTSVTVFLKNGKITCDASWIKHVRLARHCHMQNMQIVHDDRGAFYLQTLRTISRGEPLFAWFTLETAKFFRIPYLTLQNIQGGWKYKCHQCGCIYKDPNPLKIHLAFYCSTSAAGPTSAQDDSVSHLVVPPSSPTAPPGEKRRPSAFRPPNKLAFPELSISGKSTSSLPSSPTDEKIRKNKLCHDHLAAPIVVYSVANPTGLSNFTPTTIQATSAPPCGNNFVPTPPSYLEMALPNFLHCPNSITSLYGNLNVRSLRREDYRFHPPSASPSVNSLPQNLPTSTSLFKPISFRYPISDFVDRAEIPNPQPDAESSNETVASPSLRNDRLAPTSESAERSLFTSEGKIRKKHKCFYCGKMYSRKYGLKIHIRTHTGFKPLSCKYCHRLFSDPSNLNKHVRLHAEGLTPYRCHLCSKVLVRKRDLDRHLKSRHPSKNGQKQSRECGVPLVETELT